MDHIRVIKLAHYAGLAQEVPSLFFSVAYFQRFYGHRHVPLSRQLQSSTAHLSKLSCETRNHPQAEFERSGSSLTPLPVPMVLNTYQSCRQQDSALQYMMLCISTQGSATKRADNWICYIEDTLTHLFGL